MYTILYTIVHRKWRLIVRIKLYKNLVQNNPEDNIVFCPVAANSALAMIFLGARGSTSWEINELLELDKMITFNPHLLYKNISDTLSVNSNNYKALSSKNILISKVKVNLTYDI